MLRLQTAGPVYKAKNTQEAFLRAVAFLESWLLRRTQQWALPWSLSPPRAPGWLFGVRLVMSAFLAVLWFRLGTSLARNNGLFPVPSQDQLYSVLVAGGSVGSLGSPCNSAKRHGSCHYCMLALCPSLSIVLRLL